MSTEYEDFSDKQPLSEQTQSEGSKAHEKYSKRYQVKNIKYGEKTVRGRVVGRAKTVVPEEEFYKLAALHSSWRELSDWFGVPVGTLRDNFADIYEKATTETKQKLRRAQLDLAMKGDRVMLIWLGKNILGQAESPVTKQSDQVLPWTDSEEDK
tara:strand:- start:2934 stop:3395 length:462 start_codon:yes stop_codon:yes gene_type:complete